EQLKSSVGAIKDPSSYEGMVQLAQAVMNIDPIQGAQLLAKAEEMKKAQMQELTAAGQQNEEQARQARRSQTLANALDQKGETSLAALVRRGDPEAYKQGIISLGKNGEWKSLGGDANVIFNTKTAETQRIDLVSQAAKPKTPEEEQADAAKTSLLKVIESKYKYVPEDIKEAMRKNVESGVIKVPKDFKEILSDDQLKKVVTPEKVEQIITDSQGEIRKVRDLRKTVEEGFLATGFGAGTASFFGGTAAATARSQLQSIQASQAFKALLDIKSNDATLGQVSNVELNLLINEVEALTQDMDDETFLQALNNIEQRYLNLVASMSGELQTVPLDSVKEGSKAYLASTNVVRIVDKSGDFRDYPLQVSENAELGLVTKTKDGYFRKGDDGVLTFIPKYLNK
ncbi:MAG TPA: hypothetical protein VMW25_03395, partial [Clostridia bacterium]|nr:hypothetical protein [Clostridia bacterium]